MARALAGKCYRHLDELFTNTGSLIAIMLGRLEMDVDECITAYIKLMKAVFEQRSNRLPFGWRGRLKAQFDSNTLRSAIEEVIQGKEISITDPFNDGSKRGCRTQVSHPDVELLANNQPGSSALWQKKPQASHV